MGVQAINPPVVLEDRTIHKYRINHVSIHIVPLDDNGIDELGRHSIDLKEADIEANAQIEAQLINIVRTALASLTSKDQLMSDEKIILSG